VNPNTAGLDNPERASKRFGSKRPDDLFDEQTIRIDRGLGMPKDDQARMTALWMLENMAEAAVPGQDDLPLPPTGLHHFIIGETLQAFFGNRADFMSRPDQNRNILRAQILVELEANGQGAASTGRSCSRASSAA